MMGDDKPMKQAFAQELLHSEVIYPYSNHID